MAPLLRSATIVALLLATFTGCAESKKRNPRPTMRLSPVEVRGDGVADSTGLVDRDTSTAVQVSGGTRFVVRFAHAVELRRVKVFGSAGLEVQAGGATVRAEAGWVGAELPEPTSAAEVEVFVNAPANGAQLAELEFLGAGVERAPRDPMTLATRTATTADEFEDAVIARSPLSRIDLSPPGAASSEYCTTASFPAIQPSQARRAFLAYEANLLRSVALQRSMNGEAPQGGFWIGATNQVSTLLDELDPETLRDQNSVLLCLPLDANAPVTLTGLRLILLLDGGDTFVDRETQRRAPALFDGDLATSSPLPAGAFELGFDRAVQLEHGELVVSRQTSLDGVGLFDGTSWSRTGPLVVTPGSPALPVVGANARSLSLVLAPAPREGAPAAEVVEVGVAGSGTGPRVGAARIVLTYPAVRVEGPRVVGERFADRAFVAGWAESPQGRGTVELNGAPVDVNGGFAVPLNRPVAASGEWPVQLRARFPDGGEVVRTIYLDDDRGSNGGGSATPFASSEDQLYGVENAESQGSVNRVNGGRVALGTEVALEVPPGAVTGPTTLGITRKGPESVPALDAGMVNVTAPANGAYRFLPKGQRFAKPVRLTLPFDPALLPEGVGADEIRSYYFDELQQRWIALPREELRASERRVISSTSHFTFMINAVLVLPDHPGPIAFDPNSIKGLAAAEPSAGMDLIQPPEANAMGTAQVSLPIRLPPARGAHQPELRIAYDSSGGNGWLGMGWDLQVPSIQVDTRFGVPNLAEEEPRYLLEGQQLVPAVEPARCEGTASPGRRYLERVARTFSRIVRCGDNPASYWFEVSDRNGTLFVFGHAEEARLRSPRRHGSIAAWHLERVVDLNGNLVEYQYERDERSSDDRRHLEPFRQVYLRALRYTGRATRHGAGAVEGGTHGAYAVDLTSRTNQDGSVELRPDEVSSARYGFKVVTRRRLGDLLVSLGGDPIRRYSLEYEVGAFGKSRLKRVRTFGFEGGAAREFYGHEFDYRDPDMGAPFGATTVEWTFRDPDPSPLGQGEERAQSRSGGIGISIPGVISFGGNKGRASSETANQVLLTDVNGDGLPDRLTGGPTGAAVAFNPGGGDRQYSPVLPDGDPAASTEHGVVPIGLGTERGRAKWKNYRGGLFGFGRSNGKSDFSSMQLSALQDADGDGFLDWIGGGTVLRGQPRDAAHPAIDFIPWAGPGLESGEAPPNAALGEVFAELLEDERRPSDVVLEWIAPYPGEVDVLGWLSLMQREFPQANADWDGVRLRVYRADESLDDFPAEQLLEVTTDIGHAAEQVPVVLTAVPVAPGTRIYFVLSTLGDFPLDLVRRSPLEEVEFSPVITYANIPAADRERVDPTGAKAFVFDANADFRLAGGGPQAMVAPASGRVRVETVVAKRLSTSNVRYCVQKFSNEDQAQRLDEPCEGSGFTLVAFRGYEAGVEVTEPLTADFDVIQGDRLVFRVESHLSLDPSSVDWEISGRMTGVYDQDGNLRPPAPSMAQAAGFRGEPFIPLHDAVQGVQPTNRWSALPAPSPMLPLVIPAAGRLTIVTRQETTYPTTLPVWIAARTRNALLFEQELAAERRTISVPVVAGEEIFFEAHSQEGTVLAWQPSVVFTPQGGAAQELLPGSDVPINVTSDAGRDADGVLCQIRSPFGGGFHGWRYGAWHGANDAAFQPNAIIILSPYLRDARWADLGERLDDTASPEYIALALAEPLHPKQLGTYAGAQGAGLKAGIPSFVSIDRNTFVTAESMHASREFVTEDGWGGMRLLGAFQPGGSLRATTGHSDLSGFDVANLVGVNRTTGWTRQQSDLLDMNGDRLLDRVGYVTRILSTFPRMTAPHTEIRMTSIRDLVGGVPIEREQDLLRFNTDVGGTANIGKTMPVAKVSSDNPTIQAVVGSASIGASIALGVNLSDSNHELIDVNGDGLPDVVSAPRACPDAPLCLPVLLNLGTGQFGAEDLLPLRPWEGGHVDELQSILGGEVPASVFSPNQIRRTSATTLKSSAGFSLIYGRSWGWESTVAQTGVALLDVTGDGLPDLVRKGPRDAHVIRVMVNVGAGFLPEETWPLPRWPTGVTQPFLSGEGLFGGLLNPLFYAATVGMERVDAVEATAGWTPTASSGWSVSAGIPFGPIVVSGSYSEETSTRATGLQLGMLDIDGDGMPDHVLKSEQRDDGTTNANVQVRLNRMGGANLLKRITRPLGGKIDIHYARTGNTVAMPEGRWVMSRVVVRDGRGSDVATDVVPGHDIPVDYTYVGGKQDRYEREFLGFSTVTRLDADGNRLVRTFLNDRLATKGLLAAERVESGAGAILVETVNEYRDPYTESTFRLFSGTAECEATRPFFLGANDWFCGSLFPALRVTRTRFYEGAPAPAIERRTELTYDLEAGPDAPAFGNVVAFVDLGDAVASARSDDLHATIDYWQDALATEAHSVARPHNVAIEDADGRLLRKREGFYDERGNLRQLISWSEGNVSADTLLHWNELGLLDSVQGPPGTPDRYTVAYGYDSVVQTFRETASDSHGYRSSSSWDYRLGEIRETTDVNGRKNRRVFDEFGRMKEFFGPYDPGNALIHVDYGTSGTAPYARTRHRLPEGGWLDTIVIQDGVGRTIQTKKTAEVHGRGVGWSVSGHVQFDAVGRVGTRGREFFSSGNGLAFVPGAPLHPARFEYDALGRTTRVEETIERTPRHPEGTAITTTTFGVGVAGHGPRRRTTTVTDPEQKVRVVYRDPSDRTVAVEEREQGTSAFTRYEWDPVGQLIHIDDAAGNRTTLGYDLLGRRTLIDNPDAGRTSFTFDAAGNLTQRMDAKGQKTVFGYEYDQLRTIDYPESRDVIFEYGAPNAPENAAGRISGVTDDAGHETRGYGPLGELVRSTRTVRPFRPGDTDKVFETRFEYDAFGRARHISYPDGETVFYAYDAGGLLKSATGVRPPNALGVAEREAYVSQLSYDEFGQRASMRLGNGSVTAYAYYPESRRLRAINTAVANRTLQALTYEYDRVGNVLGLDNNLPAASGRRSGPTHFDFGYDDLHRLTSATGTAESRPGVVDSFVATYAYDAIHNMRQNTQVHVVTTTGLPGEGVGHPPATNHDLAYTYANRAPHQATRIGDTSIDYDLNGNVERECRSATGCGASADHLRRFFWNEENRLLAVVDGGGAAVTRFVYDAAGERVAKLGRGGESLTIGQFFSLKGRKSAAKHVFAGTTRIATKIVPPPGWQPAVTEVVAAAPGEPPSGSTVPGCQPSDYQPQKCDAYPGGDPVKIGPPGNSVRPATYYYHSDHLGSTGWVTDQNGQVREHVEYFPYGQVWRDVRGDADGGNGLDQRFLFTGKELDEETGLYYFGARYYDPVRVRWASTDPLAVDLAERRQQAAPLSSYSYVSWRPLNRVDPDGLADWFAQVEGEAVGIVGFELAVGVVFDSDHKMESGVFISFGPAFGLSYGVGVGGGRVERDIEGDGVNIDVNLPVPQPISGTAAFDDKGLNGGAASYGPGAGASVGTTKTKTLTLQAVWDSVRRLFGGGDSQPSLPRERPPGQLDPPPAPVLPQPPDRRDRWEPREPDHGTHGGSS